MMKKTQLALVVLVAILFAALHSIMMLIVVEGDVGQLITTEWCKERKIDSSSTCLRLINSRLMVLEQALSLTLFLLVIISTVVNMEWRVAVAILAVCIAIMADLVSPRMLIDKAISWDLILFLVGSMTLAGILRSFGVFKYLAIQVIKISKKNVHLLLILIAVLSYATAAILGEVTSIIYVAMVVIELANILKFDVSPLLILAILATNTGSSALPIGNPIGIYLYYTSRIPMPKFVMYSLPLSMIDLCVLLAVAFVTSRRYIASIRSVIEKRIHRIEAFITHYYTQLNEDHSMKGIIFGIAVLVVFVASVLLSDRIAFVLTSITGVEVDGHSLLSFIPYVCIALTFIKIHPQSIARFLEKSVEWSSIIFFIMLFMLSYTLMYTGAMLKIAYVLATLNNNTTVMLILILTSSAILSAFLDNLSVIVALSPIALLLTKLGAPETIFFALLFGGVFGGNYSPIGSTANIVAISLAEKKKIKIGWGSWAKIALVPTTLQILTAMLWLYIL